MFLSNEIPGWTEWGEVVISSPSSAESPVDATRNIPGLRNMLFKCVSCPSICATTSTTFEFFVCRHPYHSFKRRYHGLSYRDGIWRLVLLSFPRGFEWPTQVPRAANYVARYQFVHSPSYRCEMRQPPQLRPVSGIHSHSRRNWSCRPNWQGPQPHLLADSSCRSHRGARGLERGRRPSPSQSERETRDC